MVLIISPSNDDDKMTDLIDYMFNIEAGKIIFKNGEFVGNQMPIEPFPKIMIEGVEYNFATTLGILIIPNGMDVSAFEAKIIENMHLRETETWGHSPGDHLKKYHTVLSTRCCNIKIKSDLKITKESSAGGKENICRRFINGSYTAINVNRFTWQIRHTTDIPLDMFTENMYHSDEYMISMCVSSIIYDADHITKYAHLDFINQIRGRDFIAYDRIIFDESTREPLNIQMSKHSSFANTHGLIFHNELSDKYMNKHYYTIRQIDLKKLHGIDFDKIKLLPVRKDGTSTERSTEICYGCKCDLYGDIYVLYNKKDSLIKGGHAFCPICLHFNHSSFAEEEYEYILRVKYPKTIEEIIDSRQFPEVKKEIMKLIISTGKTPLFTDRKYITREIGDKYLLTNDVYKYIRSGESTKSANKIVCYN